MQWSEGTWWVCGAGGQGGADLEGAATDSVSLIFILLMAGSKGKLVDEVQRHAHLLLLHHPAVPVPLIQLADVIHIPLHQLRSQPTDNTPARWAQGKRQLMV